MRARINERLEHATRFPVTLIVAPAGFGKSVALRDFIESSHLEAVRYDVHREDASLLAFVRRLSEALEPVAPTALASFPTMQERVLAGEEPVRQISDWFAEHLKRAVCTIVIDDLHYAAADPASIALLADLIERTGERIKWIIAARSDVGLPVATWIAYGRMDIPIGEDELRLTTDEALAAAAQTEAKVDIQEIEALRHLTEGWPVALTIALRTRTHSADLRTAAFSTREMIYRYLAEQVFAALSLPQRAFALSSCVFSTFDSGVAQALGATSAFLDDLRAKATFLSETAPGEYRYHDLFRDFLEMELRRSGDAEWKRSLSEAAKILQERGQDVDALLLYAKAKAGERILSCLHANGFSLLDRGNSDALSTAIDALGTEVRQTDPAVLGLSAMLKSARGLFDLAEPDFKSAIEASRDATLRYSIVSRYAIELVRQGRDCISLVEPYCDDSAVPLEQRIPLMGTLATSYVAAERTNDAVSMMERALDGMTARFDDAARARLYHQAAYVFQFSDPQRTERYANQAIETALAHNLYGIAARAYSALYTVRYQSDDALGALSVLQKLDECARKAADNQARLFGLMASYEVAAERADDAMLEALDKSLLEMGPAFTSAKTEALQPALAMQAAWTGDFRRAYEIGREAAPLQSSSDRRALYWSELAFYAFAAGLHEAGEDAMSQAVRELARITRRGLRAARSLLFLALAQLVRGHDSAAHRYVNDAETLTRDWPRARALAHAVRVLHRIYLGQSEYAALQAETEQLRRTEFGGIARLLAALPPPQAHGEGYSQLTPAEREILQLLAAGASTKDIAARTTRSPHTVDTHIRAICRKLNCSGRREAVALAVGAGWVHA
ncbi:MAG TPA: LuxR C-terminal-related transcriptional regulator [Candidatus Baltobacteraceae bacterium]|nr:LuxR C-terminal-related transcriptional regulator [Candidatus Baltobacteraceae bacterium]